MTLSPDEMSLDVFRTFLDILESTFTSHTVTARVTSKLRPHRGEGGVKVTLQLRRKNGEE